MAVPNLADVKAYLGDAVQWSDSTIQAALDAEAAAQARVCRIPGEFPDDLAEALLRRVARTLAMRRLPLGAEQTVTDIGMGVFRPGLDVEIKRLEAPWRKMVAG